MNKTQANYLGLVAKAGHKQPNSRPLVSEPALPQFFHCCPKKCPQATAQTEQTSAPTRCGRSLN